MPLFRKRRQWSALQIEVTSRCTRRCEVCPRSVMGSAWRDGDMDEATWACLRDDLDLASHVHLQGWGEPLLHPHLPEMVDDVKAAGADVGFTTNGDLLSDATGWIVERAVDLIAVSTAGDAPTHAALRDGSRLEEIWNAIGGLVEKRGERKRPKVQVSYLLTLDGLDGLARAVATAAAVGVDELFVVHLDFTPTRAHLEAAAFDEAGLRPGVAESIAAAESAARSGGIVFRGPMAARQGLLSCALDPTRFVFVGWDGRVGPCVQLLPPVDGPFQRWTEDGPSNVRPVVYGRLADAPLRRILEGEKYRRFTAPFVSRAAAEGRFRQSMGSLFGSQARSRLDEADRRREEKLAAHPFPPQCAGCHKAVGW